MSFTRRDFIKSLAATAALMGSASAIASSDSVASKAAIEKSIKASFGGGFSLISYSKSGATTQAKIENFGNQYTVTSMNLLDWKIIQSSLSS
ncbi:MAG: twin-arginine translocation signal domain-containing protein [Pseudomonadota bacterium]